MSLFLTLSLPLSLSLSLALSLSRPGPRFAFFNHEAHSLRRQFETYLPGKRRRERLTSNVSDFASSLSLIRSAFPPLLFSVRRGTDQQSWFVYTPSIKRREMDTPRGSAYLTIFCVRLAFSRISRFFKTRGKYARRDHNIIRLSVFANNWIVISVL